MYLLQSALLNDMVLPRIAFFNRQGSDALNYMPDFLFFLFISLPSLTLSFLFLSHFFQYDTDCKKHTELNNHNNRINEKQLTHWIFAVTVLSSLHLLTHLILTKPLWGGYNSYPHHTDEKPDITYLPAVSESNELTDALVNCKTWQIWAVVINSFFWLHYPTKCNLTTLFNLDP